jgi:ankyrin repeat protein
VFIRAKRCGAFDINAPIDCDKGTLLDHALKEGKLTIVQKLLDEGAAPSEWSDFVHLLMQKLIEQHASLPDEEFKELIRHLLPQMLGRFSASWTNTISFSKAVEVFIRAKHCGAFDINDPIDCEKGTLLHHAVKVSRYSVVQKLVDEGSVPTLADANNKTAFDLAKARGNAQIFDIVLRKMVQLDKTLLVKHAQLENGRFVYRLLLCGAEVPDDEALINKILNLVLFFDINFLELSDKDLKEKMNVVVSLSRRVLYTNDDVFLFLTAGYRTFNLLQQCGALSGPVFRDGLSLMHWAALRNNVDLMKQLISMNAKLDCQVEYYRTTPLHIAVLHGHIDCVSLLSVFPQLVQITSLTTLHLPGDRVAQVDATPFDLALRLERLDLIDVFIDKSNDPVSLFDPLYKAYEQAPNAELMLRLRKAVRKSPLAQNSLRSLVRACEMFLESNKLEPALILHLAGHRSLIPYFEKAGYRSPIVPKAHAILYATFSDSPIAGCFMSYGESLIERLKKDPEKAKMEAVQFKEACLAFRRMHAVFALETPVFILPLHEQIGSILQQHSSCKKSSELNYEASFDETDGCIVVGDIFVSKDRKDITKYGMDAYAMGLSEGRDFRALGIDNNLAELSKLVEQNKVERTLLEAEIDRKQALLKRLQQNGVLSTLKPQDELDKIRQWEFTFNIHLLEWVFSKKDRLIKITEEHKVDAVSKIKNTDIISLLMA